MSAWRRFIRGGGGERSVAVQGDVRAPIVTGDHNIVTVYDGNGMAVFTLRPLAVAPVVPADAGPAALLVARHELVEFTGREPEGQELGRWLGSTPRRAARLVTGAGGQGKTRLALQVARSAAASRWRVLVARHRSDGALIPHETAEPVLVDAEPVGTLILVDYADRWPSDHLLGLFERPEANTGRVRSLLLGRSSSFWGSLAGILNDAGITPSHRSLGDLPDHQASRERMYDAAVTSFAGHLGVSRSRLPARPDLRGDGFELTLAVHMAALVAVLSAFDGSGSAAAARGLAEVLVDPAALSRELLNREVRHWERLARDRSAVRPSTQEMARAVLVATLTRGLPTHTALPLLTELPIGPTPTAVIDAHTRCYPPRDPGVVLEPLYPDRLGEDFVAAVLPGGPPDHHQRASLAHLTDALAPAILHGLLQRTVPTGGLDADADPAVVPDPLVGPMLTVLTETARRWRHVAQEHLRPVVDQQPHLLLQAGGGTIARLARIPDLATALPPVGALLDTAIGGGSHLDLDTGAVAVSERLVDLARQHTDLPTLATSLTTFGVRLASVGRRAEGLAAADEAVTLYRELVAHNRDAHLPALAGSVNNLANRLGEVGRRAEGLAAAEEAVTLRRELVARNRDAYLPALAGSVNNLAIRLAEVGRRAEGLAAADEAITLYRDLSGQSPDLFDSRLDAAERLAASLKLGETTEAS